MRHRAKILVIFMVVLLVFSGCNVKRELITAMGVLEMGSENNEDENVVQTTWSPPKAEEMPAPVQEDPLRIFKTTESDARELGGLYLIRNGQYYALMQYFRKYSGVEYPSAVTTNFQLGEEFLLNVQTYYENVSLGSQKLKSSLSMGKVPVPVIEDGDKIVFHSSRDIPELEMRVAKASGYSLPIDETIGGYIIYDLKTGETKMLNKNEMSNFEIKHNGQEISEWWNLEEGTECALSWYQGTNYQECRLVANCRCYRYEKESTYKIEGNLSPDGLVYDLSSIPAGYYKLDAGFAPGIIIEIK